MKINILILCALLFSLAGCHRHGELISWVDPTIGTGGHGHTFPGATVPLGMVQLSPDTRMGNWDACSGYHYSDSVIYGFSHTHLSGTGCIDLGDILFRPTTHNVDLNLRPSIYQPTAFSHQQEEAHPGYYKVFLPDEKVQVELTATSHVGVHRYLFPVDSPSSIIIDPTHQLDNEKIYELWIQRINDREIAGYRRSGGWAEDQKIYFYARFSAPIEETQMISDFQPVKGKDKVEGKNIQAILTFNNLPKGELSAMVGISGVSADNARENLETETENQDFDLLRTQAENKWEKSLAAIQVEGGTPKQQKIFYTAMYHSMVSPNQISDSNGAYRGMDKKEHIATSPVYSTFSLWDTFRAWHPLMTIIHPELAQTLVQSMLKMYQESGELPIWPLASNETGTMIGYHAVPVIADAHQKELRQFDVELAYEAMIASANTSRKGHELYREKGFIPANWKKESVSCLLEDAYDDWCIAQVAQSLGKEKDYQYYRERSLSYRNVFDGNHSFFRGKNDDGNWAEPFDPNEISRDLTEATPWQYRFFAPHDVKGMINLFGGPQKFTVALDSLFNTNSQVKGELSDVSGLIGQYAHGNEPSHHMAYLYNYAGQPWKTQQRVRQIMEEMYDDTPTGICGNEDCGQMSAWYIMSSLGFYPVCPGSGEYLIGSPLFKKATISLTNEKTLVILTQNHAPKNIYVQQVLLNGKEIEKNFITHKQIMNGGELIFVMGSRPNKERGTKPEDRPYSLTTEDQTSIPYVRQKLGLFTGPQRVELGCTTAKASIYYTLNGSQPDEHSTRYSKPFIIDQSQTIKARAYKEGYLPSIMMTLQAQKADYQKAIGVNPQQQGVSYSYFEGEYHKVRDLSGLTPIKQGVLQQISLAPAQIDDHFGFDYNAWIKVPEKGIYEFYTQSDDGSVLYINNQEVVNNDGSHAAIRASGKIALGKGFHKLRVLYFEDYEGQALDVGWKGPDIKEGPIDGHYLFVR